MKTTLSILAATICALAAIAHPKVNLSNVTPDVFVAAGRAGKPTPMDFIPQPKQFVARIKIKSYADNTKTIQLIGNIYGKRQSQKVMLHDMTVKDADLIKKVRPVVTDRKQHTVLITLFYENGTPIVKAIEFLPGIEVESLLPE